MSASEDHIESDLKCHRCGKSDIEDALLPYKGNQYCYLCWHHEVDMNRGGEATFIVLLMIILALVILLPFVLVL